MKPWPSPLLLASAALASTALAGVRDGAHEHAADELGVGIAETKVSAIREISAM